MLLIGWESDVDLVEMRRERQAAVIRAIFLALLVRGFAHLGLKLSGLFSRGRLRLEHRALP
jgi:hypothetical protein